MSFRRFAKTCAAGSALALALTLATSAAAAGLAGELPGDAPTYPALPSTSMPQSMPQSMPMPAAPDMRPEWRGANAALQPDGRARDAWLRECRRRTEMYYDGYRSHRRNERDRGYAGGYDYCEAYLDDYYRTYAQPGYAHAYAHPVMMAPVTQTYTSRPVEEVVTEEYVPLRSRYIPRRPARRILRDKRIRVAP
jgi:hypothetical protein